MILGELDTSLRSPVEEIPITSGSIIKKSLTPDKTPESPPRFHGNLRT